MEPSRRPRLAPTTPLSRDAGAGSPLPAPRPTLGPRPTGSFSAGPVPPPRAKRRRGRFCLPWRGTSLCLHRVAVVFHPRRRALQAPASFRALSAAGLSLTEVASTFSVPGARFFNVCHPICNGRQQVAPKQRTALCPTRLQGQSVLVLVQAVTPGRGAQVPSGPHRDPVLTILWQSGSARHCLTKVAPRQRVMAPCWIRQGPGSPGPNFSR